MVHTVRSNFIEQGRFPIHGSVDKVFISPTVIVMLFHCMFSLELSSLIALSGCMWIYSTVVCEKAAFFTYKSVSCQPLLNGQPLGSLLQDKHIFQGNKVCRWGNNKYSVKYRLWRDNLFTEKMRVGTEQWSICFHLLWVDVCTFLVHNCTFQGVQNPEVYRCLSACRSSIHPIHPSIHQNTSNFLASLSANIL